MGEVMHGYVFATPDRKLRVGRVYRLAPDMKPVLRKLGYHASAELLDALRYAAGPILCSVELRGTIIHGRSQAAASECKVLSVRDVTRELCEFALWCAERALKAERQAGREPDPRSWAALAVKRAWLDGKATDRQLKAAYAAARSAALAAGDSAKTSSVRSAAVSAAHSTSPSVAVSSAHTTAAWVRSAAYWAARSVSVSAEGRAQARRLARLLRAQELFVELATSAVAADHVRSDRRAGAPAPRRAAPAARRRRSRARLR